MEKKKRNNILLISLVIALILNITFFCIDLFYWKNIESLSNNENVDNNIIISDDEIVTEEEDVFVLDDKKNNEIKDNDIDNKNYNQDDVISYFENIETEVDDSTSFKERFKEYFITITDFIFYDKEIKGYTFDELSGTAKAKIIFIALKIDNKIEEYIPGYKESILDSSDKIYMDIKERLITLYMDISVDICSNGNENDCAKVKEIFSEIISVCKIGWDFIKNLVKNGTTKVREWYEVYSGK